MPISRPMRTSCESALEACPVFPGFFAGGSDTVTAGDPVLANPEMLREQSQRVSARSFFESLKEAGVGGRYNWRE